MEKENILVFLTFTVMYLVLATILNAVYFSSKTVIGLSLVEYPEYRIYLYMGVIFLAFSTIVIIYMTFYIGRTIEIIGEERKKKAVEYLFWSFFYISLTSFMNVFIYGIPGVIDISTDIYLGPPDFKFFPYIVITGLGNFYLLMGLFYMILFSLIEFSDKNITAQNFRVLSVILILFIVSVLPTNYYALKPPTSGIYTRPILLLVDFLLSMIIAFYSSLKVFSKAKNVYDVKTKKKLLFIGFGFMGFFFFLTIPLLGILLFKGTPLFLWYSIGFAIVFVSMVLIYLGFLTPSWLESRL